MLMKWNERVTIGVAFMHASVRVQALAGYQSEHRELAGRKSPVD